MRGWAIGRLFFVFVLSQSPVLSTCLVFIHQALFPGALGAPCGFQWLFELAIRFSDLNRSSHGPDNQRLIFSSKLVLVLVLCGAERERERERERGWMRRAAVAAWVSGVCLLACSFGSTALLQEKKRERVDSSSSSSSSSLLPPFPSLSLSLSLSFGK